MPFFSAMLKKHPLLAYSLIVLIVWFSAYKLIGYLYFLAISTHYKSYIPASFIIERTVFAGDQIGGFIEGCGVAVFKLSKETSERIAEGGIAFLNVNSPTRESKHKQYMSWHATPIAEEGKYHLFLKLANEDAGGNTCVDLPESLKDNISLAIRRPGAFYSGFNEDTELLVIPTLNLAIFSHDR